MYRHGQSSSTPSRGQQDPKPPKPPERPLVPFMRYSRKMWHKIKAENPDRPLWDIGKLVGQQWRELSDSKRAVFQQEYEAEKVEYEKAMKVYQASPAYQHFLTAKNRTKAGGATGSAILQATPSVVQTTAGGVGGRRGVAGVDNAVYMIIQPLDDEDPYEMTAKKLAAIRYERNNRLMTELFSSNYLPDTRSVVHQQRIEQLRRQTQNLTEHQNKLNDELARLEENFGERKRRLESASEEFARKMKKVMDEKPELGVERYTGMVAEWEAAIKRSYDDFLQRNKHLLPAPLAPSTSTNAELAQTDQATVTTAGERNSSENMSEKLDEPIAASKEQR